MILYALHAMLERNLGWDLRPRVLWGELWGGKEGYLPRARSAYCACHFASQLGDPPQ